MNQESDLKLIDDVTLDLYNSICFKVGMNPPVENLKYILLPSAKMIRNSEESPEIMTVDDFIISYKEKIADETIKSFYEGELHHITELFGKIAHRFSTYETKFDLKKDEHYVIGINSIQYIKIDDKWKISSIVWNNQTSDLKIPEKHLPKYF